LEVRGVAHAALENEMSILDVTCIRGLLLVSNQRFERHLPARADGR
jgi:hypothetical protein